MRGARVLIVDDERIVADSLGMIFERCGSEARVAYSAEEAIEVIGGWKPALAVVDVVLPRMNGIELAILLEQIRPSCRVLLISGEMATAALAEEAAKRGHPYNILAKPVPPPDLLGAASQLLAG